MIINNLMNELKRAGIDARFIPSTDIDLEDDMIWINNKVHIQIDSQAEQPVSAIIVTDEDGGFRFHNPMSDVKEIVSKIQTLK